jgi:hypothetical protein
MSGRKVWYISTIVSEEPSACIIRLKEVLRNGVCTRIVMLVKELLSNLFIYLVLNVSDFWIIVSNRLERSGREHSSPHLE